MRRVYAIAGLVAVLAGASGCGLWRYRVSPEELATLPERDRARLARFEERWVAAGTRLGFAERGVAIAEARLEAAEAKVGAARDLARWAGEALRAARLAADAEDEERLAYCRARYRSLDEVLSAEVAYREAALAAAEAVRNHAEAELRLAEAELERARVAAVLQQPGRSREQRDKEVGRWNEVVEDRTREVREALVDVRLAERRHDEAHRAWLAAAATFDRRFRSPCAVDWQLPHAGEAVTRPPSGAPSTEGDGDPLELSLSGSNRL